MTTASVNFGWEVMVALIALFITLMILGLVALLRLPRSHKVRVGFFLERDVKEEAMDPDKVHAGPDEDTAEWPLRDRES